MQTNRRAVAYEENHQNRGTKHARDPTSCLYVGSNIEKELIAMQNQ
jgi:hypothetical protein